MQLDMARFRDTFFEEAYEHLGTMENVLLQLDERGSDEELLNAIFRAAHSIKGASGTFGFTAISRFTHVLENVLDRLRSGRLEVQPELTRTLLRSSDVLGELLGSTSILIGERVWDSAAGLRIAAESGMPREWMIATLTRLGRTA